MNKTWKKLLTWILTLALLAGNVEYVQAENADTTMYEMSQETEGGIRLLSTGLGTWYWPVPGHTNCSQGFSNSHKAIDIAAPQGVSVCAAKAGTIRLVINDCDHLNVGRGQCVHWVNGYSYTDGGNQVYITHDDGTYSIYAHMIKGSITVTPGQRVIEGQVIGQIGQSGMATGPHLHFGVSVGGSSYWSGTIVDPSTLEYTNGGGSTAGYTITDTGVTEITQTSARINFTISPTATVNEVGFYYGTAPDNMTKVVENYSGHLVTDTYQLGTGKWTGALTPGTTYYYKMYMVLSNGTVCESQIGSFTTIADTQAPLITNVKVTDLDRTGYTVQCDVTDDIGVTKVAFPTWTEANGQDDLPDTWSELCAVHEPSSGNTYVYRVNIADHNNETGLYTTHIYAYDAAGNVSTGGITAVVTPLKITEFSTVDKKTSYNFGADIVFCVSADGGSGNYQYQFAYVYGEDPERIISDYSEAASVSWKPDKPGKYMVVARVKDSQGEVSSEPVEINVLCQPHNYNKSVTPPSCTEQGYTTYTCTRCNDSYVSDYTNALGHTWGEQEILKEATLEQAGTVRYTCTVCGASYTEEVLIQFRVLPVPAQKYTGKAVKPTLTVYDGTVRLVSGRDYTVSYTDNIKAGTASAVIYGKGNYQGSKTVNFTILPQSLNDPSVTVSPICAVESGRVQKPLPTVKWNGKALRANLDYTVTYPSTDAGAYQKAGEYVIHVEAKNGSDFSGGFDVPYSIVSKDKIMMSRLTVKTASAMYTGAPVKPVVTVKKGNALLREGTDYQILGYSNNTEIGTAYVTIQGMGNYGGIRMVPFKITGISMSKVKVEGITDQVYDGTPKKQSDLFVTYQKNKNSSRIELVEGKDYTVVYSNNMNAGTASVTLKGKGGYSGSITKKFKIKRADAKDTILLGDNFQDIVKYEKGGARPIPEFYFGNVKLKYGTDYSLSYTNNKSVTVNSAKAATVKAKFKGKFTGSVTLKFFIDTGTFDDALMDVDNKIVSSKPGGWKQSKVSIYDGNGKKLSAGTDYNKKLIYSLDKDGEQILTGSETLPVGTSVYVTAYGIKNYEGAKLTGVYNIVDESINNANIIIKEKNYTGKAVTLEKNDLSVRVGSKELVYGVDYVITQYSKNVKKGTAKVTIKGIGKYCGEKKASFVIAAKKF